MKSGSKINQFTRTILINKNFKKKNFNKFISGAGKNCVSICIFTLFHNQVPPGQEWTQDKLHFKT